MSSKSKGQSSRSLQNELKLLRAQMESTKKGTLALRDLALMYGQHKPMCAKLQASPPGPCSCNWDGVWQALNADETFAKLLQGGRGMLPAREEAH